MEEEANRMVVEGFWQGKLGMLRFSERGKIRDREKIIGIGVIEKRAWGN